MSKSLRIVIGLAFGGGLGMGFFLIVWTFIMVTQWPLGCMPDYIASNLNCMSENCPESCAPERDILFYGLFFGLLAVAFTIAGLATYWFVKKVPRP